MAVIFKYNNGYISSRRMGHMIILELQDVYYYLLEYTVVVICKYISNCRMGHMIVC